MPGAPPYGEYIFGHEYAGVVVAVGSTVDEFQVGDRVVVQAHLGCRRCENCIRGLYTACLNHGNRARGHRANGFTTNAGLAEYALNPSRRGCRSRGSIAGVGSPRASSMARGSALGGSQVPLTAWPGPRGQSREQLENERLRAERIASGRSWRGVAASRRRMA